MSPVADPAAGATPAVLALGSNLGQRAAVLRAAVEALDAVDGIAVDAVSGFVETAPVGAVPDQPDFLNAVVLARTTLTPRALLAAAHAVEAALGLDRARKVPDGPRVVDVDLVALGTPDAPVRSAGDGAGEPVLPHPRAHERAFVLAPWLDVDPDAVLPGPSGGRVRDLLARLGGPSAGPA